MPSDPRTTAAPATPDPSDPAAVARLLGVAPPRPWWRRGRVLLPLALAVLAVAGAVAWEQHGHGAATAGPVAITQPVVRGDLALTVAANGTLQPTRSVSVGSELSGTVASVAVDINDRVRRGQVLLTLDTTKLIDQIARSRATLASAQASVAQAQAAVTEARATLGRMEKVHQASGGQTPAATELDTARATLAKAQAAEGVARASVADATAALHADEANLAKATIRSPIDGVVLTRSVEPGNAVAASLQAVTLFTLAEDLSKMTLKVNVDEADVGSVQAGQRAEFTVSSWPNRRFPAAITKVGYGSTTTDNVVSYPALLDVANTDLTLRPGMTATATIRTQSRQGVLLVPNAALRFTPAAAANAGAPPAGGGSLLSRLLPGPPRMPRGGGRPTGAPLPAGQRTLWLLGDDGQPRPLVVSVGLSDGQRTEVSGNGLQAGQAVIVEQQVVAK